MFFENYEAFQIQVPFMSKSVKRNMMLGKILKKDYFPNRKAK